MDSGLHRNDSSGTLSTMLFFVWFTIILFILGAAVGSFINVVISRSLNDEQWVKGRSHCDHCGQPLAWYDMFPLLSYLFLTGKSRCCKKSLSISHPVVEFLSGTLFVWWFWGGSLFFQLTKAPFQIIQPAFWLLVGLLLLIIFFVDLSYMIIPDWAVGLLLIVTLLYRIALTITKVMLTQDLLATLVASCLVGLFFFGLWFFTKGKGMGFGDVKFSLPMTLLLGWPLILVGLFISFLTGAMVGVGLILLKKKNIKQAVPFGPFLVIGTLVTLVFGDQILSWYLGML